MSYKEKEKKKKHLKILKKEKCTSILENMVEENNNGQNGHLPNTKLSSPAFTTTTTMTSETNKAGKNNDNSSSTVSTLATKFMNWIDPFVDFSWFILCSIGFILKVSVFFFYFYFI